MTQTFLIISPNKHCGLTKIVLLPADSSEAQGRKINIPGLSVLLIFLCVPKE